MKITKEQIQSSTVRMLTLNEPFATLMAYHGKQETRNRDTKVRGLVAIHSAQKWYTDNVVHAISGKEQYFRMMGMDLSKQAKTGHIVAIGYLTATKKMGDHPNFAKEIEDKCFVKYNPDLWIWEFEDMTPIEPIPFKGKQGWKILSDTEKLLINPI